MIVRDNVACPELLIRGGIEDNLKIIFLISQKNNNNPTHVVTLH